MVAVAQGEVDEQTLWVDATADSSGACIVLLVDALALGDTVFSLELDVAYIHWLLYEECLEWLEGKLVVAWAHSLVGISVPIGDRSVIAEGSCIHVTNLWVTDEVPACVLLVGRWIAAQILHDVVGIQFSELLLGYSQGEVTALSCLEDIAYALLEGSFVASQVNPSACTLVGTE